MGPKRLRALTVSAAMVGVIAAPGSALASPSAYDQYVPLVPNASGPSNPTHHGHGGGSVPLSQAGATSLGRITNGRNRALLSAIATSRELGATSPATRSSGAGVSSQSSVAGNGGQAGSPPATAGRASAQLPSGSGTLSAATDALGRSPVLPLCLFAALAGALVAGVLRRRRA